MKVTLPIMDDLSNRVQNGVPGTSSQSDVLQAKDKEEILRTPQSEHTDEQNPLEADVTLNSEHDVKSESDPQSHEDACPESDNSKKEIDTSKAVTFAEDIEVYDLSSKLPTPITITLDTPLHLSDQLATDIPSNQEEIVAEDGTDGIAVIPVSSINDNEAKNAEDISHEERTPTALRPSVLSLNKEINTHDQTPEQGGGSLSETEVNTTKEDAELKSGLSEDLNAPKEFTVSSVDESELLLASNEQHDQASGALLEKEGPGNETQPVANKALDGFSHSTDSNYQDTIGPLENPAFLRTLHYSTSQFDEEDQSETQSNLDLPSVVALTSPDLDGGWAWVVLASAFFSQSIIGATVYSAGVLMSAVVEVIEPDLTKASWVGSVHVFTLCVSGPLVGAVLKKLGARLTVCMAGIVMSLGFLGASFATSILQLILTHGFIAGVGSGFVLNPMFVTVGQYFNRYRGVACGMLATGAGAGMLTGGVLVSFLLEEYGLSGTYLLWSAIVFHITAIGMLIRPSPQERIRKLEKVVSSEPSSSYINRHVLVSRHNSVASGIQSLFGSANQSMMSEMDKISQSRRSIVSRKASKLSNGDIEIPLLKAVLHKEMSRSSHSVSTNRSLKSHVHSPTQNSKLINPGQGDAQYVSMTNSPSGTPSTTCPLNALSHSQSTLANNLSTSLHFPSNSQFQSTSTLAPSLNTPRLPPSSPISSHGPSLSGRPYYRMSVGSQSQTHFASMNYANHRLSLRENSHAGDFDNESLTSIMVSQLRPIDAIHPKVSLGSRSISTVMGSLASFPTALAIVKDDLSRFETGTITGIYKNPIKNWLVGLLDSLRLLRNKPFLVFMLSCFMWAISESPVIIYLSTYAMSRGTSKMHASFLYTTMGIGSILGRFLSGLVSGDKDVGPVIIFTGCLGVAGTVVVISPIITSNLSGQMAFSCLVGIYTGALVPLTSLITIDLLGINELALGFGFLSLVQGFGYLIGPPLSGFIVTFLGYEKAFSCAGALLIISSFVAMAMTAVLRHTEHEDDDEHSLDDLEHVLRRISDSESEDGEEVEDEEKGDIDALGNKEDGVGPQDILSVVNENVAVEEMVDRPEKSGDTARELGVEREEERLEPIMEVVGK